MKIQKLNSTIGFLLLFKLCTFQAASLGSKQYFSFQPARSFSKLTIQTGDTIPTQKDSLIYVNIGLSPEERSIFSSTKYTPRVIKVKDAIFYNRNESWDMTIHKFIHGIVHLKSDDVDESVSYQYNKTTWQRGGHFIFDIYNDSLIYHSLLNPTYIHKDDKGYGIGALISVDSIVYKAFYSGQKKQASKSNFQKIQLRGGFVTSAYQNRQNGDSLSGSKVTLTNDSISAEALLKESWYDFHIDKKGKTHAFVYMRGELIYLLQKKASQDPDINTWQEIFSVPASEDIGPFTSVTVKGKQYLFTQDGTIFKNTGKTMTEVGKLPGDLRNTSVVWDKKKDKMWYITKEQLDAYKVGYTEIINQMNKISFNEKKLK